MNNEIPRARYVKAVKAYGRYELPKVDTAEDSEKLTIGYIVRACVASVLAPLTVLVWCLLIW